MTSMRWAHLIRLRVHLTEIVTQVDLLSLDTSCMEDFTEGPKYSSPPLISNRHLAHSLTYLGEGRDLLISNAATDRHDCTQHHRRPSPSFASPDLRKSTTGGPDFNTAPIITPRRLKNAEIAGYDAASHYGSLTGITFAEVSASTIS